ncbi:MAG TPA: T9SS type A sorting domain-containing protein [Puia sp.]|nr:T9SS type A sorting domain-containing protein [Puia sp.]
MKKFYLSFLALTILCFPRLLQAQVYNAIATGNWSAVGTWDANGIPPDPCNACAIHIAAGVSVNLNVSVQLENNSKLYIGNNSSSASNLIITNQLLYLFDNSVVRLANINSYILVTGNTSPNPPNFPGIGYFPTDGDVTTFTRLMDNTYTPTLNCGGATGNPCNTGTQYGPAISDPVTSTFISTFSLPVKLVRFIASLNNNQRTDVSWETSMELNANYFSVQRSPDAVNFQELGKVKAKGFSSVATSYFFADPQSLQGTAYYRLEMVDLDGLVKYSRVIAVSPENKGAQILVFSNPFKDRVRVQILATEPGKLNLTLTDIMGRAWLHEVLYAQPGTNQIDLQPSNALTPGLYLLSIKGNTISQTIKLIKE